MRSGRGRREMGGGKGLWIRMALGEVVGVKK